jgi:hypothetical protein
LNWKIGRLLPLEDSACVFPEQTVRLCEIASVAHAVRIYGWQCVVGRQLNKPITLGQKERFAADYKCAHPLTDEGLEGRFDLAGTTCVQNHHVRAERKVIDKIVDG